ncbi:ATP-binding protein [Staphylococcus sp. HMSC061G12]|uniref:ATP-binding protein n=1 Tax=Staphylococcus sp. HMSC061G12 TaxID=1739441 RepID=UPI0008A97371|nr:DNA replication protein DnaC [Staphylococcus sp. HMSC061G12]
MQSFSNIMQGSRLKKNIVEEEHGLKCESCGRTYDYYKFSNGQEFRHGCDCAMIEAGKEATKKRQQRKIDDSFNQSTINPSIKDATVNNYIPNNESQVKAKKTAIEYVQNFTTEKDKMKSILFRGSYGTGKSHLAYAIAKAIKNKGYKVAYMQIPDLMDRIKATYNNQSYETFDELKMQLINLDLLVLDDIGVSNSDHDLGKLYTIVNNRQNKNNIFTTNFKESELNQNVHWHRINSRMKKGSRKVNVIGDDYRERDAW